MVKNSFTLIEMMVVVTIILLLSGASLAWYGNLTKAQSLDKELEHIRSLLEAAKTNASTGSTELCTNPTTSNISGYDVEFTAGSVALRPNCDTSPTPVVYKPSDQLIVGTPVTTVHFNTDGTPASAVCLPFGYVGSTRCSYLNVSETGLITSGECTQCTPSFICPCN
jgi:prepilin-type N-terminal cleavage/methylation domain-containing protein